MRYVIAFASTHCFVWPWQQDMMVHRVRQPRARGTVAACGALSGYAVTDDDGQLVSCRACCAGAN